MLLALINLDKWNSLPKYYQAVLEQAGHTANNWMMAKYDQVNPPALKKLLAGGTKLHAFSPEIMQASFKSAMEIYAEISATNPFKKVYASLTDFANGGYEWWQVASSNSTASWCGIDCQVETARSACVKGKPGQCPLFCFVPLSPSAKAEPDREGHHCLGQSQAEADRSAAGSVPTRLIKTFDQPSGDRIKTDHEDDWD